jgi:hypothetical protein
VTTQRQIAANRANARKSTGPRTEQGKARASRNALSHGLSIPVLFDSGLSSHVKDLVPKIVGENSSAALLMTARAVAEAQVDIDRIRHARLGLLSGPLEDSDHDSAGVQKCKTVVSSEEPGRAKKVSVNLSNRVRALERLERYERRALSRRKAATRVFDAARDEGV